MKDTALLLMMPLGSRWKSYSLPSTTTVCPALLPPWQRLMMSASVASRSTTLPLPSSPHCAPSTTVTREPVAAASCCSRPRLTPPAPGGRSLEARVADMLPGPSAALGRPTAGRPARPRH